MKLPEVFSKKQQDEQPTSSADFSARNLDAEQGQAHQQLTQRVATEVSQALKRPVNQIDVTPGLDQDIPITPHNPNDQLGSYNYPLQARKPPQQAEKTNKDLLNKMGLGVVKGAARVVKEEAQHLQGQENIGYHFDEPINFKEATQRRLQAMMKERKKAA